MPRSPLTSWLYTTGLETVPDAVLLRRYVVAGDRAALELLVRRHADAVWTACQRLARHQADAEDAFQATFLALTKRAGAIRRHACLAGWLYRVAVHAALKAKQRSSRLATSPALEVADHGTPTTDGDLAPLLLEEVGHLAERYRLAVVLCDLEGRTQAEAAKLLGWKLGTLSGRLTRARRMLRGRLTRRGLTLAATGPAFALQSAAQAAGPALIRQALVTSTALTIPAGITTLAKGALSAMLLHKLKNATVTALVVLFLSAGAGTCWLIAAEGVGQDGAGKEEAAPQVQPQPAKVTLQDGVPTVFPELSATTIQELDQKCPLVTRKVKPPVVAEESPLMQLAKARLELVLQEMADRREAYRMGSMTASDMVRDNNKLKQAVDDVYSRAADRRPWYRERVVLARLLEDFTKQRHRAGGVTRREFLAAQQERLTAEMDLLRLDEARAPIPMAGIPGNLLPLENAEQASNEALARTVFNSVDKNTTGKISRADFPRWLKPRFDEFDVNHDDSVNEAEFLGGFVKMRAQGTRPQNPPPGKETAQPTTAGSPESTDAWYRALDKRKTGKIARADVPGNWQSRFEAADKNQDGAWDLEELRDFLTQRRAEDWPVQVKDFQKYRETRTEDLRKLFARYDKNRTLKIQKTDLPTYLQPQFEDLDANRDGTLERDEFVERYDNVMAIRSVREKVQADQAIRERQLHHELMQAYQTKFTRLPHQPFVNDLKGAVPFNKVSDSWLPQFAEIDTDQNGIVTFEEFKAYYEPILRKQQAGK